MTDAAAERRPTILEVAHLAGVSHQTVSRYFRDNASLKPDTRTRVDAAVRELAYRPNLVARSMRTRQTGRLAVIVPKLTYSPARLLAGASAEAHAAGYSLDILSIDGGAEARAERVADLADSRQVDGIVCFAPLQPMPGRGDGASTVGGTTILVSADFDDEMRGITGLADASPVVELIDGLAAAGHTRFLHVTGSLAFASARARRRTFLDALAERGLEASVVEGDWSAESGIAAIEAMPETGRPTAVIAGNDVIAAGVIRAAVRRGWRVPDDLSVTGWDNHALGAYLLPSLTTVDVDLEQLGASAMTRLIAALRGEDAAPAATALARVIWRESTGGAPLGA